MQRVSTAFVGQVSAASSPAIAKLKGRARATNDAAYVPLAGSHRAQSRRRRDPGRDLPRRTRRSRGGEFPGQLCGRCRERRCREGLTPAQEAAAVARRKEIYKALHPETVHGGDQKSSRQNGDLKGKAANESRPARPAPR